MDIQLKKRIIGASVLVILAATFLPMLIEEPDYSARGLHFQDIPETPPLAPQHEAPLKSLEEGLKQTQWEQPVEPARIREPALAPAPGARPATKPPVAEIARPPAAKTPPPPPTVEMAKIPPPKPLKPITAAAPPEPTAERESWVIQLGSFSVQDNAQKLTDQLKAKGLPGYTEAIDMQGKKVFRVRVGPEANRSRLEKIAELIDKELQIKGRVIRYP